jgi:vancomycin permeability regulator SanA
MTGQNRPRTSPRGSRSRRRSAPAIDSRPPRRDRRARPPATVTLVFARGLALFFGVFGLLNAVASWRGRGFGQNVLWIDPRPLPDVAAQPLVALAAALLLVWAVWPDCRPWRRWSTMAAAGVLAAIALWNAGSFYWWLATGAIDPLVPIPLSLFVGALMVWLVWVVRRPAPRRTPAAAIAGIVVVGGMAALLFPLCLMVFFGTTRYERPSDAAVVLGAQVFRDGSLSPSLSDRVRTGADLYLDRLAQLLIVSGGRGDGGRHECDAMRSYAEGLGVPADAIVEDRDGVTTQATVDDTMALFRRDGIRRVLVVSQFYHLPRIKMAYQRAGIDVWTVPARADHFIKQTPLIMAREIPAFWLYYLRGLTG